ncbi:MAG: RluA family pseudouridine synthase [Candidatus Kuenenia sp.]|nr:RluA family pseudouridine synthase [Candidatus Kuenenia hertensis]
MMLQESPPQVKEVILEIKRVNENKRIDRYISSRFPDFSRTYIQKLVKEGAIVVNGSTVKSSYFIKKGDVISATVPVPEETKIVPEDIPLNIIYEDDYLMIINKPYDMVVHPAGGHPSGTLVNAITFYCQNLSQINGPLKAGIVHRLDRDTSGVMLVIKSDAVHSHIAMQFEKRLIQKEYIAVVEGEMVFDSNEINMPIGRHKADRQKMAVRRDIGKSAVSVYEVIERFRGYTLVKIMPKTGRTHQIRVHMQAIGHPIVADAMYSKQDSCYHADLLGMERPLDEEPIIDRQALHAHRIEFFHPVLDKQMAFQVDLTEDVASLVKALQKLRPC